MQNKYSYWYFQKALSLKFCEQIIQCGKEAHKIQASVGKKKKMSKKDLENTRDCKISFLNQHWIYKEIFTNGIKTHGLYPIVIHQIKTY